MYVLTIKKICIRQIIEYRLDLLRGDDTKLFFGTGQPVVDRLVVPGATFGQLVGRQCDAASYPH